MHGVTSRRRFLADVSRGALVATVGSTLVTDLGLSRALAEDRPESLDFGPLESLVRLMQDTPVEKLLPQLVQKLGAGSSLKDLVAAAALANARTFGGEDYVGFHTMMALSPAFHMSRELPSERQALPVFKVLYRNTNRLQQVGGHEHEALHPVQPTSQQAGQGGAALQAAVRGKDATAAEAIFAALASGSASSALDDLLYTVEDNTEVHRVVLPYRAWELLDIVGPQHAHTMLRQSVRYCLKAEGNPRSATWDEPRTLLPKLLEEHKLLVQSAGARQVDDAWVEAMAKTIFESTAAVAAAAIAAALAEGIDGEAVGQAIALAANQLILRDQGRPPAQTSEGKPPGSVHGDSIGVHACDSANAWRNLSRVSGPRNRAACLILGAYQVALDRVNRGGDFLHWQPWPVGEAAQAVREIAAEALLAETETAIRAGDQARASALVDRYGQLGHDPRPAFDLLLRYAISEDGALHAEKYYRTVSEEFAFARPGHRWRQLVGLARVTASEFGRPAPGYAEACDLLGV